MQERAELEIARTWEGGPIAKSARVRIRLVLSGPELTVDVEAPYYDDPPPVHAPGVTPHLWEHEVVEVFLLGEDEHYLEIELGPHGHHLVLELEGRRRVLRAGLPIAYEARIEGDTWYGQAQVPSAYLPAACSHVNAYAIAGTGARRRYLAMAPVPGAEPDFHRLEHFVPLVWTAPQDS